MVVNRTSYRLMERSTVLVVPLVVVVTRRLSMRLQSWSVRLILGKDSAMDRMVMGWFWLVARFCGRSASTASLGKAGVDQQVVRQTEVLRLCISSVEPTLLKHLDRHDGTSTHCRLVVTSPLSCWLLE